MLIPVVGAQWGSEAKGLAIETLTKEGKVDVAVRTGSLNAGHTVYYKGKPYAMQQLPCSWIDPKVILVLGAGAYVNPKIFRRELEWLENAGLSAKGRTYIDWQCGLHDDSHALGEVGLHERMGSTGKGCMAAMVDRMRRNKEVVKLFVETDEGKALIKEYELQVCDTSALLNDYADVEKSILLEGTQGTFLDFYLGVWPYVTTRQTHAAAWLTEAGLAPSLPSETVLVVRTYPIRVAGNSGPMPQEITWPELAREFIAKGVERVNELDIETFERMENLVKKDWKMPVKSITEYTPAEAEQWSVELVNLHKEVFERLGVDITERLKNLFEITTVTKKLRRIAKLDTDMLRKSIQINRPAYIFLNFLNYAFPKDWGVNKWEDLSEEAKTYIANFKETFGVPVKWVSTSPVDVIKTP